MDDELPKYAELPGLGVPGVRHAWRVFGAGDELGTLNLLTDDRVASAVAEVRTGRRISVQLPPGLPDPPLYGREPATHTVFQTGRNSWDDRLDALHPQAGTQWDGFRHVRFREFGFFGGETADPPALGDRLGVHHWARHGIVGRGVLLDARSRRPGESAFAGRSISAAELRRTAAEQDVEVRPGDLLCVRTGWAGEYRALGEADRELLAQRGRPPFTGLAADEDMAELLWDWHIAGLACDNPAVEVSPGDPAVGSLHRRLLALLGIPLGELFDFEELAGACAGDGRWSFLFVSMPMAIAGGVGSPANPVAIR
ncbi:cyclase family protein [Pseudonocardia acaciae]|uniref:cyclase family protein n=1 Tax=Pseudonocardia acaciae TaxID=551276 RepID=UPI00048F90E4|nr:cyclase family protein [Pseudonocardia acaciae]